MYHPGFPIEAFYPKENLVHFLKKIYRRIYAYKQVNPKNLFTVTKEQYQSYYKFTVVRNPWARAFSWYKNRTHRNGGKITEKKFENYLKEHAGKKHLEPQTSFIKDYSGKIKMDYIIRFENLQEEFQYVAARLSAPVTLPHELKSSSFDYRGYYTDVSYDIIQKVYKEEIVLFNYSFL